MENKDHGNFNQTQQQDSSAFDKGDMRNADKVRRCATECRKLSAQRYSEAEVQNMSALGLIPILINDQVM